MFSTIETVLTLASVYAQKANRQMSTVSRLATGSGETFARLRRGGGITTRRAERALQWFSDNWSDDVPWPVGVPRPAPNRTDGKEEAA